VGGTCSRNGEEVELVQVMIGKPEGRKPLRRPRYTLVNNIQMDIAEI
jgi:hypothetical protein